MSETALAVPIAPVTTVKTADIVSMAGSAATREKLIAKNLLTPDTLRQAKLEAAQLYPQMHDNPLMYATYGADALKGLNDLFDTLFREIGVGKDPEVAALVKRLSKSMDEIKHKYDASNPRVIAKYNDMRGGVFGFINGAGAFWRMFLRDVRSIQAQLDSTTEEIGRYINDILRTIAYKDEQYKLNETEIDKVIYALAVMELVRELGVEDAQSIQVGDASMGDRGAEIKRQKTTLINNLSNRIGSYKTRLFMGFATSPRIGNMQTLNYATYGSLQDILDNTLPSIKGIFIDIAELRRSQKQGQVISAVNQLLNDSIQQYALNAGVIVPQLAMALSAPALAVQSVHALADSFVLQADGFIKAINARVEGQAELDNAFIVAKRVMDKADGSVSDAIVDAALKEMATTPQIIKSITATPVAA